MKPLQPHPDPYKEVTHHIITHTSVGTKQQYIYAALPINITTSSTSNLYKTRSHTPYP